MREKQFTITDFLQTFKDENTCLLILFNLRYGERFPCPKCKKDTKYYRLKGRKTFSCPFCANQLSPLAGTIFHKSRTPLRSWLFAIYKFANSKNGVAAAELQRDLGVTYKTAYRMGMQIRKLFKENLVALSGIVEIDETFIGGKMHRAWGAWTENKTPVAGAVERGGRVVARAIPVVSASIMTDFISKNISDKAHIMADDNASYTRSRKKKTFSIINHSRREYVRGNIHTNAIEGFWSQLKRSISGTHHSVKGKTLQPYLDEFAWKYRKENLFEPLILKASKPL